MKEVIPFYKEIVFKKTIANLTSISLEHNEKVVDGEVSGEFVIFGDYKVHNDTTEKEEFKYRLPFTAIIPDNIDISTVSVDVSDFRYEQIDVDVLRIDIDFVLEGKILEDRDVEEVEILEEEVSIDEQIDNILKQDESVEEVSITEPLVVIDDIVGPEGNRDEVIVEEIKEEKVETMEEYVTYHVHVVSNADSIENIIKQYNTNLDLLNEYNDIKELKVGDKVIIPEYNE